MLIALAGVMLASSTAAHAGADSAEGAPVREPPRAAALGEPRKHAGSRPKTKRKKQAMSGKKAKRKKKQRVKRSRPFTVLARTQARAGAMHGLGVRRFDTPLLETRTFVMPRLRFAQSSLWAALGYSVRTTDAGDAPETRGAGRMAGEWRPAPSLRLSAGFGVAGVHRPGWSDPYQPEAAGQLLTTDRYSYLARELQAGVAWGRHRLVTAGYSYRLSDYREDTRYEPIERPDHIAPADHEQHMLTLESRWRWRRLRFRAAVAGARRHYFYVFARDAGTGATHASAGGAPPNPLFTWLSVEPRLGASWISPNLELDADLGYALTVDTFAGYYTRRGLHPVLHALNRPTSRLSVELTLGARLVRYGSDSYAPGPSHPSLDDGSRRYDERFRGALKVGFELGRGFGLDAVGSASSRQTNFPDYRPGVFPASARLSIDWDYQTYSVALGLRYRALR